MYSRKIFSDNLRLVGEVHVLPDGDDADACAPQVLQLHQAPAVAADYVLHPAAEPLPPFQRYP